MREKQRVYERMHTQVLIWLGLRLPSWYLIFKNSTCSLFFHFLFPITFHQITHFQIFHIVWIFNLYLCVILVVALNGLYYASLNAHSLSLNDTLLHRLCENLTTVFLLPSHILWSFLWFTSSYTINPTVYCYYCFF